MNLSNLTVLVALLAGVAMWSTVVPARQAASGCESVGQIRFVCGQDGPEDLVQVPGTPFLVASAYGPGGGLFLIDTARAQSSPLYDPATLAERFDGESYPTCPGPLAGADRERFQTHGLFLDEGSNGRHTLYAVHHGRRESVEIFELTTAGAQPGLTWIGCVVAPDPIGLNAVIALPEGGLAATNFDPRAPAGTRAGPFSEALLAGERNGEVWEWHAASGWEKVPGSESAGANGLELSGDGRWYYVAQWGNRRFMRLSRGRTPVERQEIELGFRVDNVRPAPDGTLLVAGQGGAGAGAGGTTTSVIGKVDPRAMTYTQLIDYPTSAQVPFATVAIQVGDEYWVGSAFGNRVSRYPVSGLQAPSGPPGGR